VVSLGADVAISDQSYYLHRSSATDCGRCRVSLDNIIVVS